MILTIGEIDTLGVFDRQYKIITNARYWINKTIEIENIEDETNKFYTLFECVKKCEVSIEPIEYQKRLLMKILDFYHCIYEKCNDYKDNTKQINKLYDFNTDGGRIFSAFYKTYGIDIESMLDSIHWWKFMSMFNDLSDNTILKGVHMHYRSYDKSTKEYMEMKPENKSRVDKMINRVL